MLAQVCFVFVCVGCSGMQLQHEKAAVLSDRDKGIARACRELNVNERKCAVHVHANFHLAGYFIGTKQDTRGPFVEFVKAPNEERSAHLLLQLRGRTTCILRSGRLF
jgi:hypothetical protein